MLRICVNVFDHADGLETTLRAVRAFRWAQPIQVTVVDGAYADFPHNDPVSTDGTLDVARAWADEVVLCPGRGPWPNEIVKRNAYIRGAEGDVYLVIDADEHPDPNGAWPGLPPEILDADILFRRTDQPGIITPLHRVFRHEAGLEYRHTHFSLWAGGRDRLRASRPLLSNFGLIHRIGEYNRERRETKTIYLDRLREQERPWAAWCGSPSQVHTEEGSNMAGTSVRVRFIATTQWPEYHGNFDAMNGDEVDVSPDEAARLLREFPANWRRLDDKPPNLIASLPPVQGPSAPAVPATPSERPVRRMLFGRKATV